MIARLIGFFAATLSVAAWAEPAGNPGQGLKTLQTEVCQECHGQTGISISPYVPKLAGQFAPYIIKEIRDFQSGARKHPVMEEMAQGLDESRLADIAAYFSANTKISDEPGGDNSVGRKLFQAGDSVRGIPPCSSCHGATGGGKSAEDTLIPMIGGQRKGYLINQLLAWRNSNRTNSPDGTMNMIAKMLTDSEIEKLAAYISGL